MAAGLYIITTDYGALYETCAEFSSYIPYQKDYNALAQNFAFAIDTVADNLTSPAIVNHLDLQIKYTNNFYDWKKQGKSLVKLFTRSIKCKTQVNLYGLINNQKYLM
jgi:glycosyltransferase involved in cell wall biosynthesis